LTDVQLYILVAIPLVGILTNTGLFLHLSTRFDRRFERLEDELRTFKDLVNGKLSALDLELAKLMDKG
jgi:Flp pilus assembly protein TadB